MSGENGKPRGLPCYVCGKDIVSGDARTFGFKDVPGTVFAHDPDCSEPMKAAMSLDAPFQEKVAALPEGPMKEDLISILQFTGKE